MRLTYVPSSMPGHVPRHLRPASAVVSRHLEVPVVEADPEDLGRDGRLVERYGLAIAPRAIVAGDRDVGSGHAHEGQCVPVDLAAQVLGARPALAVVGGDEHPVSGHHQAVGIVIREEHRRGPVEPVPLLPEALLGADVQHVAGDEVVAEVRAAVGAAVAVGGARTRVGLPIHAVAVSVLHPVVVDDADPPPGLGRPHERVVVLKPRVDPVRVLHVHRDGVHLGDGEVVDLTEVVPSVV
jgi:hypothetical protein